MRNIGYGRVSTVEQNLDLQVSALKAAGCEKILTDDGYSGSDFSRPGLTKLLRTLSSGDTLTVWRLDRLGRSLFERKRSADGVRLEVPWHKRLDIRYRPALSDAGQGLG